MSDDTTIPVGGPTRKSLSEQVSPDPIFPRNGPSEGDLPCSFGRYELQAVLGEGGMGRVFRAELRGPAGFRKLVAIKIIKPETPGWESSKDLIREARIGGRLKHPNIVDVYELGGVGDRLFISLELVEGLTLGELIQARKSIPPSVVLQVAIGVAAGLVKAHGLVEEGRPAGLVHCDLKPNNILISWDGAVKIADFGIAVLTGSGTISNRGTPSYMSPEHLRGEELDGRSDLFSLALVIGAMVLRRYPIGKGWLKQKVLAGEALPTPLLHPRTVEQLEAAIPGLGAVLLRCLAPDRDERYPDAESLHRDLQGLQEWVGITPRLVNWLTTTDRLYDETQPDFSALLPANQVAPENTPTVIDLARPARTNLGPPQAIFIGREEELTKIRRIFDSGSRLVTLTGPGGAGKTRVARRFARRQLDQFEGGAWFADLTEACTAEGLLHATASALDVAVTGKDFEGLSTRVGQALASRGAVLLVLDNFEQVVEHGLSTVGRWRELAPEARFLVTSREHLKLQQEEVFALGPLPEEDGVELFESRAQVAGASWTDSEKNRATIGRIVTESDGLPLAIELAAARARLLSPAEILERLSARFELLRSSMRDVPPRQATLRGALDWSWDLLQTWEQSAMAQLSVFRDGFFMEAAEEVLDLSAWPDAPWSMDVVGSLLDKSLLRSWRVLGQPRFGMYLSVREYAAEKLERNPELDLDFVRLRAAACFARLGTDEQRDALYSHGGTRRLQLLALELENLLEGVESGLAAGEVSAAGACALAVFALYGSSMHFFEGAELLGRLLAREELGPPQRMRLVGSRGWLLRYAGRHSEALEHYEGALVLARELGDRRHEGIWLGGLGYLLRDQGHTSQAWEHTEAALAIAREVGDPRYEGIWRGTIGLMQWEQGQRSEALQCLEAALTLARKGGDRKAESTWRANLGLMYREQGRMAEALASLEPALAMARERGDRRAEGTNLGNIGELLLEQGDWESAAERLEQAIYICDEMFTVLAGTFRGSLALVRARAGDLEEARALLARGEEQIRGGNALELGKLLCKRCRIEHSAGDLLTARAALVEAVTIATERGVPSHSELGQAIAGMQELVGD